MFTFTKSDVQRITVSSVGALLLTVASVVAVAGPAKAAELNAPVSVTDWQDNVQRQIDRTMRMPSDQLGGHGSAVATVAIRFDANGDYAGASMVRPSKVASADREALRVAGKIAYPSLPQGMRGRPQTVAMRLYFGVAGSASAAQHRHVVEALASAPAKRHEDAQIAALPTG